MKVQETIREDGLRIISCRTPSRKIYLELIANIGSAHDPPGKYGLFHFFEHMAFASTKSRTRQEINSFLARYTLDSGAFTDKLVTVYHGNAVLKKFGHLCRILSDIYFHSTLSNEDLDREREVISNEIAIYNDDDSNKSFQSMFELLWENNPIRRYGTGTQETIRNVTRNDLLSAKKQYYNAANTTIVAVGEVRHEDLINEINSGIPTATRQFVSSLLWDDELDILPKKQSHTLELPQREKAIVLIGCKMPFASNEKEQMIATLFNCLLIGSYNSRLWREVQEKRGLVYSLYGGISGTYNLANYFYVCAQTLPGRIDAVQELILSLLEIPFTEIETTQFNETREWLNDWYSLDQDELSAWATLLRRKLGRNENPKRIEKYYARQQKNILRITTEEVEKLRSAVIKSNRLVTVIAKPT